MVRLTYFQRWLSRTRLRLKFIQVIGYSDSIYGRHWVLLMDDHLKPRSELLPISTNSIDVYLHVSLLILITNRLHLQKRYGYRLFFQSNCLLIVHIWIITILLLASSWIGSVREEMRWNPLNAIVNCKHLVPILFRIVLICHSLSLLVSRHRLRRTSCKKQHKTTETYIQ